MEKTHKAFVVKGQLNAKRYQKWSFLGNGKHINE